MDFIKVKQLLAEMGVTQKEMCEEIGLRESSLSGIKSGQKKAGIPMVLKIAKYLNVNPTEIAPEYESELKGLILASSTDTQTQPQKRTEQKYGMYGIREALDVAVNLSLANRNLSETAKESNTALIEIARYFIKKER